MVTRLLQKLFGTPGARWLRDQQRTLALLQPHHQRILLGVSVFDGAAALKEARAHWEERQRTTAKIMDLTGSKTPEAALAAIKRLKGIDHAVTD